MLELSCVDLACDILCCLLPPSMGFVVLSLMLEFYGLLVQGWEGRWGVKSVIGKIVEDILKFSFDL